MYLPFHSPPMPLVEPVSSPLPKAPNISLVVDLKSNKLPIEVNKTNKKNS